MTLSIDIQHNSIECHYAQCRYAECRDYLNAMLSVVMLNVIMLSVVAPATPPKSKFAKIKKKPKMKSAKSLSARVN